jgi:tRNA1Val (adenine37-N6)-methyltransferase
VTVLYIWWTVVLHQQISEEVSVFRFKQFDVVNESSAMKVNTDGVLLGAAMTVRPEDRFFLDVGTGTGTIALMAAQRIMGLLSADGFTDTSDLRIDAIDIDRPSAAEAEANFRRSPWSVMLNAANMSLDEYADSAPDASFNLIFSNPPYFESSLPAPQERRNAARHTSALSYRELLDFAAARLSAHGRISMVLPADQEAGLCRHARMCGLHLFHIMRIRTVPRKMPSRIIAEFSRSRCLQPVEELLTIQDEGKYTEEYLSLTRDFYLFA